MAWPPDPDIDTAIRVGWWLTLLGVVIFVVSAVGEWRGWWDLVGEVGMLVGSLLTIGVGVATWFSNAGRKQLTGVGQDVRSVGRDVRAVGDAVVSNGRQLSSMDGKLDKLDVIERALVAQDGQTSRLDVVQVELDRQTHVLDRQVGLLTQIRDRL